MNLPEDYLRLQALVETAIKDSLSDAHGDSAPALLEAMRYTLFAKGKRLRPVLLLMACEAAGGEAKEAMPFALAIEYIHNYSLIHDDLPAMDDDDLRRGVLTNHKVFGEGMAILAGDGLLSLAFETLYKDLLEFEDKGDSEKLSRHISAGAEIAAAAGIGGMVAGQATDIQAAGRELADGERDAINAKKTGALIRSAVVAGGYIGGGNDAEIDALRIYGEKLGLAFQYADDILDAESECRMGEIPILRERLAVLTAEAIAAVESLGKDGKYSGAALIELAKSLENRSV